MAVHASKVLQARSLTPEQRLDLAAELLASVDGEPPETWESTWRAELDERMVEMETGAVRPVPWAEARARLRARLAGGREGSGRRFLDE
jgi:putative addiction module component (TIGR02574 family)